MPNKYTINLINKNVASQFAFFQAPPKVKIAGKPSGDGSAESGDGAEKDAPVEAKDIFTNVWVAKGCDAGGQVTVTTTVDFYSWAGTAPEKAAVNVTITSGKALPVTLGAQDTKGTTVDVSVDPKGIVVSKVAKSGAPGGTFETVTQPFSTGKAVVIGMSKPDPDYPEMFRPTAVINGTGNMHYTIKPINNYYVAKFASEVNVGQILDFKGISEQKGLISFSDNPGTNTANVIFDDEGVFQVNYS